jgi:hypothetical protein
VSSLSAGNDRCCLNWTLAFLRFRRRRVTGERLTAKLLLPRHLIDLSVYGDGDWLAWAASCATARDTTSVSLMSSSFAKSNFCAGSKERPRLNWSWRRSFKQHLNLHVLPSFFSSAKKTFKDPLDVWPRLLNLKRWLKVALEDYTSSLLLGGRLVRWHQVTK